MDKLQIFNKTYNDFIYNLNKCFDIDATLIDDETNTLPLQAFIKTIETKYDKITAKDNTLFNEPFMLDQIEVSELWKRSSVENREVIWKFVQTLSLVAHSIKTKSESLDSNMKDMLSGLVETNDTESIENIFDGTKIGSLAKDIASTLDMSSIDLECKDMQSPDLAGMMQKLTTGGGGIQKLVKDVSTTLDSKLADGSVNRDDLKNEVETIVEKMKGNPKLQKMMKSKDMRNMMQNMMNSGSGLGDDDDFGNLEEMFKNPKAAAAEIRGGGRRSAAKAKLRRKLAKKRAEATDDA